jgi:drug/metabolite transporter (DMT)-like permease
VFPVLYIPAIVGGHAVKKGSAMVIACYLTIYFVWGSTYFFIKMAVETIPPFYVLGFRFLIGGILFFVVSLAGGRMKPFPKAREILSALVLGTLLLLVANGLVTVAEKQISSYIVALVLASTPIFVAFFNRCIFKMPISPIRLAGILIGVIGVGF